MASEPIPERRSDAGSVLMLMPAAVLIVLVLGAIAVDSAVVFNAQRELVSAAQAAANDAASFGIDEGAFRQGRGYAYDAGRVDRAVAVSLSSDGLDVRHRWYREGNRIVVELEEDVVPVFSKALPGGRSQFGVHARASARLLDVPAP